MRIFTLDTLNFIPIEFEGLRNILTITSPSLKQVKLNQFKTAMTILLSNNSSDNLLEEKSNG